MFHRLTEHIRETYRVESHKYNKEIDHPLRSKVSAVGSNKFKRRLPLNSGESHMTGWRILKQHKMHTFRMSLYQELQEDEYQHYIDFCTRAELQQNDSFFNYVIWCEEETFAGMEILTVTTCSVGVRQPTLDAVNRQPKTLVPEYVVWYHWKHNQLTLLFPLHIKRKGVLTNHF